MPVNLTFSTKCVYALRTILELTLRRDLGVVQSRQIASAQGIPLRFLEIILSELRQGGFVESKRGNSGGYVLTRPAETITVGQVIDFIEGHKSARHKTMYTKHRNDDSFDELWQKLERACSGILNSVNFADLANEEIRKRNLRAPIYVI